MHRDLVGGDSTLWNGVYGPAVTVDLSSNAAAPCQGGRGPPRELGV